MRRPDGRDPELLRAGLRAYQESGISGVARRIARRGLSYAARELASWERTIRNVEFERRLARERERLDRNVELRNRHAGGRVFVIGNGPSLRTQDLGALTDRTTFVVNAFHKHPIVQFWQPTYYFATDGNLLDTSEGSREFLHEMARAGGEHSRFFFPIEKRALVEESGQFRRQQTYYLALNGYLPEESRWRIDLTGVIPSSPTVVQNAMIAALYMGASEIVLLGCDHDWLDDFGNSGHFYGDERTAQHLPPNAEALANSDYEYMVEYVGLLFSAYRKIQQAAQDRGCRIINATPGGRLDLFERGRYEELTA